MNPKQKVIWIYVNAVSVNEGMKEVATSLDEGWKITNLTCNEKILIIVLEKENIELLEWLEKEIVELDVDYADDASVGGAETLREVLAFIRGEKSE